MPVASPEAGCLQRQAVDVCLVVEGCYPFITGGVSTWLDWLMRTQPQTSFGVVALTADERPQTSKYEPPANLLFTEVLPLNRRTAKPGSAMLPLDPKPLTDTFCRVLKDGDTDAFADLIALVDRPIRRTPLAWARRPAPPSYRELMGSQCLWQVMVGCFQRLLPHASFPDFFWAWRHLVGGLFSILTAPVPPAKAYHAISTGYAGLHAARAAVVTGRPAAITEHGIYTSERRIDLIMADWIGDTIAPGLGGTARTDVRDFWIQCFESYARIAYATAARITTLYRANQQPQRALGAAESRLEVIANGIDLERFDQLERSPERAGPTIALVGRVVPIKDAKAFIQAVSIIQREIPDVSVLVIGPTDEDHEYFNECRLMVDALELGDTIRFTGRVNILDYLPRIDVVVLTSVSEAQPLVLLEAGAAGIPCVATDVGSCREIIEGAPDEVPQLGPGGRVAPPMAASEIGAAVVELLRDETIRSRFGETLRRRVERHFSSEASAERYARLYRELTAR